MERKTFSFDNSIEKREVENIGHKITITVGDITDDIMPLFEKSVEGDFKAKLEMYRKIYDRQVKERSTFDFRDNALPKDCRDKEACEKCDGTGEVKEDNQPKKQ